MYVGTATLCLRVSDLQQAVQFYEAIGMKFVQSEGTPGQSAFMRRGDFYIMLMNNFGADSVTFRGADAFDVFDHLRADGFELEGHPGRGENESYWSTRDPDGHGIFFNTHRSETTSAHRQAQVT